MEQTSSEKKEKERKNKNGANIVSWSLGNEPPGIKSWTEEKSRESNTRNQNGEKRKGKREEKN